MRVPIEIQLLILHARTYFMSSMRSKNGSHNLAVPSIEAKALLKLGLVCKAWHYIVMKEMQPRWRSITLKRFPNVDTDDVKDWTSLYREKYVQYILMPIACILNFFKHRLIVALNCCFEDFLNTGLVLTKIIRGNNIDNLPRTTVRRWCVWCDCSHDDMLIMRR